MMTPLYNPCYFYRRVHQMFFIVSILKNLNGLLPNGTKIINMSDKLNWYILLSVLN